MKIIIYLEMEELRRRLFNSIDIVMEKDYVVLDQLTKLELQAKLLSLHIIAGESILTVLKMLKEELIRFILDLNMCYMDVTEEETSTEDVINIMNDTQYNGFGYNANYVYDSQYNVGYSADYVSQIDWSHSNQYSENSYWSHQDQFQNYTYPQEYGWNGAIQY